MSKTGTGTAGLLTYLALTFGWTWGLWAAVTLLGGRSPGLSTGLLLASAFGPSLAAVAKILALEGKAGFGRWLSRLLKKGFWGVAAGKVFYI